MSLRTRASRLRRARAFCWWSGRRDTCSGSDLEGIWKSKINLSFLTHSNQDEFAHKSFEIAACEGFLLVERSEGHLQRFVEDEEAVFFSTIEECVEKVRRYLPDEAARSRIAAAGRARAERSGYHNDRQVGLIVERAKKIIPRVKLAAH